jgi:RHS repeat-associated protein
VIALTYPDGKSVLYQYDANDNITLVTDRNGQKTLYTYDELDRVVRTDRTNRVSTFNTYDSENRIIERENINELTGETISTYRYTYDSAGNRTLYEKREGGQVTESLKEEYNALNQVVTAKKLDSTGWTTLSYQYDANGNLIEEDDKEHSKVKSYTYTKENELKSVREGDKLVAGYLYDGEGNRVASLDRDLDLNQNLSSTEKLSSGESDLLNLISESDKGLYELTEYVNDINTKNAQVLMQRDGAGNLSTAYVYGNERLSAESYNNLSGFYTYDGRGSVSDVTGPCGEMRKTWKYDAFGNATSKYYGYGIVGEGKSYFGYNAESYNPNTGLMYLRARYLNMESMTFQTKDSYEGTLTEIYSLNRYAYVQGNPVNFRDPSGNDSEIVMAIQEYWDFAGYVAMNYGFQ